MPIMKKNQSVLAKMTKNTRDVFRNCVKMFKSEIEWKDFAFKIKWMREIQHVGKG